jgi:catechol 2,3-dioxygenase-like lactoylglutathione lyase family enzyme
MDWKLQLIVIPVSDMDRAKRFYTDNAGFDLDVDHSAGDDFRVIQLTPPGSACSVTLMKNPAAGTLQGLHLIVDDIEAARDELAERGVDSSEIFHFEEGGQLPGPDPQRSDYGSFLSFNDPDGNGWLVQEVGRQTEPSDPQGVTT